MPFYPKKREEEEFWPFGEWTNQLFPSLKNFSQQSNVSVWEEEGDIVVEAALAGIRKDEVDLTFEKGVLTICAQKKEEKEDKNKRFYQKAERSFSYKLAIPGELDEQTEPQASLNDGILQIRFKKHERTAPKTIEIKD